MKRILVVDDEIKIVEVIQAYLLKEGYEVGVAYNGIDGFKKASQGYWDLIILDLMLPDKSGEEICEDIRVQSNVPIIMLTAKVQEDDVLEGFSLGADDYVSKPFSPRQLMARVKAILKRVSKDESNILIFNNGDLKVDIDSYEVYKDGFKVILTPSEFKILLALCQNPKRVFTRDELLRKALGDTIEVFDRVVDSHIKNIRAKIEEDTKKPRYILTVHGIGYKFGGE